MQKYKIKQTNLKDVDYILRYLIGQNWAYERSAYYLTNTKTPSTSLEQNKLWDQQWKLERLQTYLVKEKARDMTKINFALLQTTL